MEENTDPIPFRSWKEKINFNTIAALFFMVFSIVAFLLIPYQIEKPKLFMGRSLMQMQPSLFPRLSIAALFFLSIWYVGHSFKLKEKNLFKELADKNYIKALVTYCVFIAYALLFEPLGFVFSSALTVGGLTLYFGNRNLFIVFLVLAGIPLSIYFIFTRALHVSLPEGVLF